MTSIVPGRPGQLSGRIARAGLWGLVQSGTREVMGFGIFLVLSRLFLDASAFGLVAMANGFILMTQVLARSGLNTAIQQRQDLTDRMLTGAFWATTGLAVLFAGVLALLARPISAAVEEPALAPLLAVLCLGLVVTVLGHTHEAILRRALRFRPLALRAFLGTAVGGAAAIAAAFLGAGVWSLVVLNLTTAAVSTAFLWYDSDWRPDLALPIAEVRALLPMGLSVTGIAVVNSVNSQLDKILIGFLVGIPELGRYYVGQRIVSSLHRILTRSLAGVSLPAFSMIATERDRLLNGYERVVRFCAAVTAPIFVGIALLAPELIDLLLGDKWADTAPILAALSASAAIGTPMFFNDSLAISVGRPNLALRVKSFGAVLQVIAILIGARWGIFGVAVAVAVKQAVMVAVWGIVLDRSLGFDLRRFFGAMMPTALACAVMATAILAMRWLLPPQDLLIVTMAAIIAYVPAIAVVDWRTVTYARGLATGLMTRR